VSAKLKRMGHKRGHKPPTANPKIVAGRTRKPALAAACAQPVDRVVSKPNKAATKPAATPTRELTKRELYAMLANAVRNTG
jgi:GcrA cell cycle regulator